MNRRKFLSTSSEALALLLLAKYSLPLASAQNTKPLFFVHIRTIGGMDATLGLDPQVLKPGVKPTDIYIDYKSNAIFRGGVNKSIQLGPAATPLQSFAGEIAIVNGIHMRKDLSHDPLNEYNLSGSMDANAAAVQVLMAEKMVDPQALKNRILTNNNIPIGSSNVIPKLIDTLFTEEDNKKLSDEEIEVYSKLLNKDSALYKALSSQAALQNANINISKTAETSQTKSLLEVKQAQLVAEMFQKNLARFAVLDINRDPEMDTHVNHSQRHLNEQKGVWEVVAEIFKTFKTTRYQSGWLFDSTVFLVTSEFSRTPALNSANGKDHNVETNSCLLAGYGIRGGQTVSGSHVITRNQSEDGEPHHIARPFNFVTSKPLSDQELSALQKARSNQEIQWPQTVRYLRPEHVLETVADIMGFRGNNRILSAPLIKALKKG